jgi:uncharacterized protein YjgD (DUF1641 family)
MAEPISFVPPPRPAERTEEGLRSARAKHAEAIVSAYELLQLLHDKGVLDLLSGMAGARDQLVETVTAAVDTPESIRAIRNFLLLTRFFGSIPPEVLSSLAQTVVEGAKREKARRPPGLLRLLWRLRSEDSRHALSVALDLIESVGKGL